MPELTPEQLKPLAQLKSLTRLSIDNLEITDAHLEQLTPLANLELLTISAANVTDAGLASLAQLKRMPVDELKIDKSFVIQMSAESDDAVIVRSTIELAHSLGMKVVAEAADYAPAGREPDH